jgi:hypothetical protein
VRITESGREALDAMRLETLSSFSLKPDPFDLAMARLGPDVLDALPAILAGRRERVVADLAEREAAFERASRFLTRAERHVMRHASFRLQAELDWLDALLADLPAIITDERTREVD